MENGDPNETRSWLGKCGAIAVSMALTGCAAQSLNATLPKISTAPGEPSRIDGNPQTVYGLIASGAMKCWLSAAGQLKNTHVFHADVEPPSKGGNAEVSILERDLSGEKLWGPRAFKVLLKTVGEQTSIEIENLKMPENVAIKMRTDVFAWAQGSTECQLKPAATPPLAATEADSQKTRVKPAPRRVAAP